MVAVAVIVFAFSLGNQAEPAERRRSCRTRSTEAPPTRRCRASRSSTRSGRPAPAATTASRDDVASAFGRDGLQVQRSSVHRAHVDGSRDARDRDRDARRACTPGSIVIVAHRDSALAGAASDLSGTAVLLELAKVLSGETQQRSVVLASTSGSIGAAGAAQLARSAAPAGRRRDRARRHGRHALRKPVVVPWSDDARRADAAAQHRRHGAGSSRRRSRSAMTSLGGQFAASRVPARRSPSSAVRRPRRAGGAAVDLGTRVPAATRSPARPDRRVRAGGARRRSARSRRVRPCRRRRPTCWSGKVIPAWAIRLLVLALIAAGPDRHGRRARAGAPARLSLARWTLWVLAWASRSCSRRSWCSRAADWGDRHRAAGTGRRRRAHPRRPGDGDPDRPRPAIVVGGRRVVGRAPAVVGASSRGIRGRRRSGADAGRARRRHQVPDDAASPGRRGVLLVLCWSRSRSGSQNPFAAALMVVPCTVDVDRRARNCGCARRGRSCCCWPASCPGCSRPSTTRWCSGLAPRRPPGMLC